MRVDELRKTIREIPDFPKPGINFYDLSTLFRDGLAFASAVDRMYEKYRGEKFDAVAGIEARGFVLASVLAYRLGVGLVLVRKPGKLPAQTEEEAYHLEYGEARVQVHRDAVEKDERVLVVDDLLATGGTAAATGRLLSRVGARVVGYGFLVELDFLRGRQQLPADAVFSLIRYE